MDQDNTGRVKAKLFYYDRGANMMKKLYLKKRKKRSRT